MITLKSASEKIISILLCMLIISVSLIPAYAAVTYPSGVTEQKAEESAGKTDLLIKNVASALEGKSLSQIVYPMLLTDETASSILTSVYGSLSENSESLARLGIDISTAKVAEGLSAYPSVAAAVASASVWSEVKLDTAKWNISDKQSFADAVASMLYPFNDVLYMILCSGNYSAGMIKLKGDDGYQNGIISMLSALGCMSITPNDEFKAQAAENRNTMISNIVLSVFYMLDGVLEAPATRLCQILPNLAYYFRNGGFEASVNALMSPLTLGIGKYISLFSGTSMLSLLMFIQDPSKYTTNFSDNMTTILNDAIAGFEFKLAQIDLDALAACGTEQNGVVTANIGEAYTTVFCWLIDTLKLNTDKVKQMMSEQNAASSKNNDVQGLDMSKIIDGLFAKSTDEIFAMLIELFTAEEGTETDYQWQTPAFTKTEVSYTANLGQEKYQRVLDGIDELMNEFVAEYSDEKSLQSMLKKTIYSPTLITTLASSVYGALSDGEMSQVMAMLGIPTTPYSLASYLEGSQFTGARRTLSRYSSWKKVNQNALYWGFSAGDEKGFKKALAAVLSPFEELVETLLACGRTEILGSIGICGSNGYNTAVIPLLEALGCPSKKILTYDEYKAKAKDGEAIESLLEPLLALIDKVIDRPVYTLTEILPNIIFFIKNGSMIQCLENLIAPLAKTLEKFSLSLDSLGVDFEQLKKKDLLSEISKQIPKLITDIKLSEPNLASLAGIGELVTMESKRTYQGKPASVSYVKADKTAVLITILRYAIGIMGDEKNSDLLSGMMSGGGGNDMFAQASGGIGEEMAKMSVDETIEWLYKLLFRERAVATTVAKEAYSPTIIYEPEQKSHVKQIVIPIIVVLAAAAAFLIIRRKRIHALLENRKLKKQMAEASAKSNQEV